MSGFTFAGSLVASQRGSPTANVTSGYRGSATYKMNNAGATVAYYKNETNSVPATPDRDGTIIGGTYKFGAFTLKGLYVKQKNAPLNNLKTMGIGGGYQVSPELTLDVGFYSSKDSAARYKMKTTGFGAQYKIIKDLSLYAQYSKVKNDDTAVASFNFAGPTIQPGTIGVGQSATTINVGALFAFF
jgi:predicted porin